MKSSINQNSSLWHSGLSCIRERRLPWKVAHRAPHLANFLQYGISDMFSQVFLDTITACNRRCYYCPNSKSDRGLMKNVKKMDTKLFHKVIDELAQIRYRGEVIPNHYGEPLFDDRLLDLIEYARNKLPHARIMLYTNGDFLTVDLYKKLVTSGITCLRITQHPGGEPPHIKEIIAHRKKFGTDNVLFRYENLTEIYNRGDCEFAKDFGYRDCEQTASQHCGVQWDGEVVFCCNDYFATVKLGNIRNERLIDIWKKPHYVQLRKNLKKGIFTFDVCKKCKKGTVLEA